MKKFNIKEAVVTRLTSQKGTDENTFETPTKIYPVDETLSPLSNGAVTLDIPAYSLNIVRLKKQIKKETSLISEVSFFDLSKYLNL